MNEFIKKEILLLTLSVLACTTYSQSILNKNKNFSVSGSVGTQLGAYYVNGIPQRQNAFIWQLNGEVTFKIRDIVELPFSFVVGESERKFNQPFNQIGISPKYKWLTIHGGFRNINWSQYSMASRSMLCVGVEVNPKFFRSGILFGRINRGTSVSDTSKLDSLQRLTYEPTYNRLGMAGKLGVGTEDNYVDFVYFRAWDKFKTDSLFTLGETGNKQYLAPSENAAFSIVTSQKIGKYINVKAEYGLSTTNGDKTLPKTGDLPADYIKVAKILMKPNLSSIAGHAFNFSGNFSRNMYTTNLNMELVTQNYNSYGAYYFQTNGYKIGAMQSIPLHKNKNGNLNINMQYLNDNLNKKKPLVNNRIVGTVGYNFNTAKFGITTQYTIAYSKQKVVQDSIIGSTSDALKLNQANHTVVLVPRYTIIKGSKVHTILLTETINALSDFNSNTKSLSRFINNLVNISYIGSIAEKNLTIQSSFFTNYIKNYQISMVSYGVSAGTNVMLAKSKLNLNDVLSTSISSQAVVLNVQIGLNYIPEKHHKLTFANNLIWNKSRISSSPSFIEYRTTLSYVYSFF